MPFTPTYPGVCVEEISSGVLARTFGTDTSTGELSHSVRLFFESGGAQCYIMRIVNSATAAEVTLQAQADIGALKLTTKNAWHI